MTNLTALIRTARAANIADCAARNSSNPRGASASEGSVTVRMVPVQPRVRNWRPEDVRADVYMDGKRIKAAEVKAILKAEAA